MGFGIMRAGKLTTNAQIGGMDSHNQQREQVKNADPEKTPMNQNKIFGGKNLLEATLNRIDETGAKRKKDSVALVEHLFTFSPKDPPKEDKKYFQDCLNWLKDTYGKDNFVGFSLHYDEKTPHLHAYVTPIKEKTHQWKNKGKDGVVRSGETLKTSLCAADWLGSKAKLRAMQDSFYEQVSKKHGLERGEKGSKAKHESVQKYYERVNQAEKKEVEVPKIVLEPKPFLKDAKEFSLSQSVNTQLKVSKFAEELKTSLIQDIEKTAKLERQLRASLDKNQGLERNISNLEKESQVLKSELSQVKEKLTKTQKLNQQNYSNLKRLSLHLTQGKSLKDLNQDWQKGIQKYANIQKEEVAKLKAEKEKSKTIKVEEFKPKKGKNRGMSM